MAIGKALKFIKQASSDKELRKKCLHCNSREELLEMLEFTDYEFEEAVNMSLVQCQSYEAADQVQQIQMWFSLL